MIRIVKNIFSGTYDILDIPAERIREVTAAISRAGLSVRSEARLKKGGAR